MEQTIHSFLKRQGMHPDDISVDASMEIFLSEMAMGLRGEKASLKMVPTYLNPDDDIRYHRPAAIIDAGGTNLRVASAVMTEKGADVTNVRRVPIPGSQKPIEKEEFFSELTELLLPVLEESDTPCGFCFSYGAHILENGDARVTGMGKGVVVSGMEGILLGEELNHALGLRGRGPIRTTVLNDSTATLLGALAGLDRSAYDGVIGLILGTGTNCCYLENAAAIEKCPDYPSDKMIINVEAGGFRGFPYGTADTRLINEVSRSKTYTYEKMVSGAYIGPLCGYLFDIAVEEGLFMLKEPNEHLRLSTKQLNEFMEDPMADGVITPLLADSAQAVWVKELFSLTLRRAAKCIAIVLTSVMCKSDMGSSPLRPACIAVEGTTYMAFPIYRKYIESALYDLATTRFHRHYTLIPCHDTNLIGAALSALFLRDR